MIILSRNDYRKLGLCPGSDARFMALSLPGKDELLDFLEISRFCIYKFTDLRTLLLSLTSKRELHLEALDLTLIIPVGVIEDRFCDRRTNI